MRDVIIACDFSSKEETLKFLDQFDDVKPYVKIGMELYYSSGKDLVKQIKDRGHKIFLDLKLHDIPNTVKRTIINLAKLDIDMINVHALGSIEMMKAAKEGIDSVNPNIKLIAVTQLTSLNNSQVRDELKISLDIEDSIINLAKNTKIAGLDGVVCSPLEARAIKEACGIEFLCVTPGIRFSSVISDDQKRITTPEIAKEIGSDYIVVGRPITKAENPKEAYLKCVKEFI